MPTEKTPMQEMSILEVGGSKYRIKEDNLWIGRFVITDDGNNLYTEQLKYIEEAEGDTKGREKTIKVAYCILYHHLMEQKPVTITNDALPYHGGICLKDAFPDISNETEFTNLKPEKFMGSRINVTFYYIQKLKDEDLNNNALAFVFYGDKKESARLVSPYLSLSYLTNSNNLKTMSDYFNESDFDRMTYSFHFFSRNGEIQSGNIPLLDNGKIKNNLGNWTLETQKTSKSLSIEGKSANFKNIITEGTIENESIAKQPYFQINHTNGSIYNINGFTSLTLKEAQTKLNKANLSVKDLLRPIDSGDTSSLSGRIRSGNVTSNTIDFSYNSITEKYNFSNENSHHLFFNGTHSSTPYNHGIVFTTPVATTATNYQWKNDNNNNTTPQEFINVRNNVNSLYYKKFSTYGTGSQEDQTDWIRILTDEHKEKKVNSVLVSYYSPSSSTYVFFSKSTSGPGSRVHTNASQGAIGKWAEMESLVGRCSLVIKSNNFYMLKIKTGYWDDFSSNAYEYYFEGLTDDELPDQELRFPISLRTDTFKGTDKNYHMFYEPATLLIYPTTSQVTRKDSNGNSYTVKYNAKIYTNGKKTFLPLTDNVTINTTATADKNIKSVMLEGTCCWIKK